MRYSKLFGKTVREAPAEAAAASYKLLYRGGFVRELVAGRYSLLPLGFCVWQKIVKIIDEEMEKVPSQRVITPALHPIELWRATARDQAFGAGLMRLKDRRGAEFALGATAEGVMVDLVKKFKPSYKDLPITIHQFSQKFRDELRVRGGLLRVREFTMKDAYSFHTDEKSLDKTYRAMYDAYLRIAERLGLQAIPVEAYSGSIGGKFCHEFMVESEAGEDYFLVCDRCGYAANKERAEFVREAVNLEEEMRPFQIIEQPEWVTTMEDNVKHYGLPKSRFLKNVVYKAPKGEIVIVVMRGDLDVNEVKLANLLGVGELSKATEADLLKMGTKPGWVHCWGHKGALYVGDESLKTVRNFIGGQKEKKTDSINVNYGRDFTVEKMGDIALAEERKICGRCKKGKLLEKKAIELGHVFKLDKFYTEPMGGTFVDEDGKEKPLWMGCYGIGVERAMATVVETHHDEKGIIWPAAVASFQVHLLSVTMEEPYVVKKAEEIYQLLVDEGFEVLYDDREESAGVKFADADLIGISWRLVVSRESLKKGGAEVKRREEERGEIVPFDKLTEVLQT